MKEQIQEDKNQGIDEADKKINITSIILIGVIALIVLAIIGVIIWFVAKGTGVREGTTQDIYKSIVNDGEEYCNTLEGIEREQCIKAYIRSKAEEEEDPDICEEIQDDDFIRNCEASVAIVAVALKYNEEKGVDPFVKTIPSNIELCDKINNQEDRELCKNPSEVINKCYHEICYKIQ